MRGSVALSEPAPSSSPWHLLAVQVSHPANPYMLMIIPFIFAAMKRLKKELEEIQDGCNSNDESRVAIAAFPLEVPPPLLLHIITNGVFRTTSLNGTLL